MLNELTLLFTAVGSLATIGATMYLRKQNWFSYMKDKPVARVQSRRDGNDLVLKLEIRNLARIPLDVVSIRVDKPSRIKVCTQSVTGGWNDPKRESTFFPAICVHPEGQKHDVREMDGAHHHDGLARFEVLLKSDDCSKAFQKELSRLRISVCTLLNASPYVLTIKHM